MVDRARVLLLYRTFPSQSLDVTLIVPVLVFVEEGWNKGTICPNSIPGPPPGYEEVFH